MNRTFSNTTYQESLRKAAAFLKEGDEFLVVSHLSPDGDAISSTGAIGLILKALGKSYTLINEGKTPVKYVGLLGEQPIVDYSREAPLGRYSRVIAVDCADYARIGLVHNVFTDHVQLLNIDHHPTNDDYGTYNLIKPHAAATVEIIYELAEILGIRWTKPLANCIYAGLLTDTGGFRYSNTTPAVLAIAERMLREGAEGAQLAEQLLETMSFPQVLLLKETLSTLTFSEDRKIAWVTVTADMLDRLGAVDEDSEGLVNIPRNVLGVEVGILFKQKTVDIVKVSLRSAGKVDVSKLAQSFGGGGHVRAAGCTINGSLEHAIQCTVEAVSAQL
jgi:phosphoesterase RecJ-like protein